MQSGCSIRTRSATASTLQRTWRAHAAQRGFPRKRVTVKQLQVFVRGRKAHLKTLAASKALAMRVEAARQATAARTLQRAWRRYAAKRVEFLQLCKASVTLQVRR